MDLNFQSLLKVEHNEAMSWDALTSEKLSFLGNKVLDKINSNNCVFAIGNGGSAADAAHFIGEFTSKCKLEHAPWKGICLSSNISTLTSIANDLNYEDIFSRQLEAHFQANDILIALSTSGTSVNILKALKTAVKIAPKNVFLLTSIKSPKVQNLDDANVIAVPSTITSRIQEVHMYWLHGIIEFCELKLENM
jgi:phosphoheptose isomerase